jgi:CHRD domain
MRKVYGGGLVLMLALAGIAVALTSVAGAGDGNSTVRAVLNGYQEVVGPGSISTTGSGDFEAKIDQREQTITFTLTYTLENPATQAHIHFAQRHVGGGVSAFLCGGGGQAPCPPGTAEQATVTGVITPAHVIGPAGQGIEPGSFGELVRAMVAGATYANVHSTRWPAGEIRGQIADHDEADSR